MRWRDVPLPARRYIIYHTIVSPFLIVWHMLPVYLFMTGYSVLEAGALFTAAHLVSIPATYVIGKIFDKVAIRHGLVLIDALDGAAYVLYGLAWGPLAPVILLAGLLLEEVSGVFYPLYQAAEKILYPKDRLEEVFAWHMRLPELSQLIGFLILGYLFGYVLAEPQHYRAGFISFGLVSVFTIAYLLKALPKLSVEERLRPGGLEFRVDREFTAILVVEGLLTLAWSLAPDFILVNYVVNVLNLTLFEVAVIEASISVGAILATYLSERIPKEQGFKAMALGYSLIALWGAIMITSPALPLVIIAYFIHKFGDTLAFPFHRAWIFSKIPESKASSLMASLSSYRRLIRVATPVVAGYLAHLNPVAPYYASLTLFIITSTSLLWLSKLLSKTYGGK